MPTIVSEQTALRQSFEVFLSRAKARGYPVIGAEIGVSKGFNSALMLTNCQFLTLYSIDHYKDMFYLWDGRAEFDQQMKDEYKAFATMLLDMFGKRSIQVFKSSMEAVKDFPDNHFDYIYIDGDHRYEAVMDDLTYWYPKLKIGGVFAGHDYVPDCKGVLDAVNEYYSLSGLRFNSNVEGDFWSIKEF